MAVTFLTMRLAGQPQTIAWALRTGILRLSKSPAAGPGLSLQRHYRQLPPPCQAAPKVKRALIMSKKSTGDLAAYLQSARTRQLEELEEWLRIPSISALPAHKQDVRRAAEWLVDHLRQIGLHNVRLIESDIHPLVYADWLDA